MATERTTGYGRRFVIPLRSYPGAAAKPQPARVVIPPLSSICCL